MHAKGPGLGTKTLQCRCHHPSIWQNHLLACFDSGSCGVNNLCNGGIYVCIQNIRLMYSVFNCFIVCIFIWTNKSKTNVDTNVAYALGMRERFPCHWLQTIPLVSDPSMHHGTCATRVPWCMSGSLTRGVGENVPGFPGACATRDFTYLVRGPCVGFTANKLHAIMRLMSV